MDVLLPATLDEVRYALHRLCSRRGTSSFSPCDQARFTALCAIEADLIAATF
jgi:hypothetical protein